MLLDRLPGPVRRWLYAGGSREDRLRDPDAVVAALGLRPGMVVADLGPGYGHFTLLMAWAVAPDGVVYALDASRETLDELRQQADERGITTLRMVEVPRDRLELPEPVELLFVSATYHHLPDPSRYFAAARAFLRPDGRLVILEAMRDGILARWLGHHATSPDRIVREMSAAGYGLTGTRNLVTGHWFGEFRDRSKSAQLTGAGASTAAPGISRR